MQKKSEILKKLNFLGQALDFLSPRKPGLYISRVDFFFFNPLFTEGGGGGGGRGGFAGPQAVSFLNNSFKTQANYLIHLCEFLFY